jgi:hypothetical protein
MDRYKSYLSIHLENYKALIMEISNKAKANRSLIALGVVAIVIVILFLRGCGSSDVQPSVVIVPEVKGKFEAVKPEQHSVLTENGKNIPKTAKTEKSDIFRQNMSKEEIKFLQSQIDELIAEKNALQEMFNQAPDSTQFKMYQKAIEPKWFDHTFDDDKLTANVYGTAICEVKSIKMDYTIKAQKIEAHKQKETFLRVLGGGGVGINKELNQFTWSAAVGFQNKKGNIIRGTYQNVGAQQYYLLGYDFSLINWKR